mmetsp:Transcript_48952/g.98493  ORF Transcript_48952/g.98493 Transcript_48952/m.98493 type:complete len:155 (+) Transcript_48952:79-543(+)
MLRFIVSALLAATAVIANDTAPWATCPVTLVNITIDKAATLDFENGQKLYFGSEDAALAYNTNPRAYWLSPWELPLPGSDGKVGIPNWMGEIFYCPYSNETMVIDMKTPRMIHRGGQNIYFCCYGCIASFWTDPSTAFEGGSGRDDEDSRELKQ